MTAWASLNNDIPAFLDDSSAELIGKLPRIISYAETRVARECPIADLHAEASITMEVANQAVPLPPETVIVYRYVNVVFPGLGRLPLRSRSIDVLVELWPDNAVLGVPKYWSLFSSSEIRVAPTPDQPYTCQIGYRRAPTPLSETNPDNELGTRHYDLLLDAALAYGAMFLEDDRRQSMIDRWEAAYQREKATLINNELGRVHDAYTIGDGTS